MSARILEFPAAAQSGKGSRKRQPAASPRAGDGLCAWSVVEVSGFLDANGRRLFIATDERGWQLEEARVVTEDEAELAREWLAEVVDVYRRRPCLG